MRGRVGAPGQKDRSPLKEMAGRRGVRPSFSLTDQADVNRADAQPYSAAFIKHKDMI